MKNFDAKVASNIPWFILKVFPTFLYSSELTNGAEIFLKDLVFLPKTRFCKDNFFVSRGVPKKKILHATNSIANSIFL